MELVQAFILRQVWPDLDGNKLAKGMYLEEKREIEKCLFSSIEGRQFFFELKLASKGLKTNLLSLLVLLVILTSIVD